MNPIAELTAQPEPGPSIGIDLGGSNLRVALFGDISADFAPIAQHREPVGENRSPEAMAERIADAVARVLEGLEYSQVPVGIAIAAMLRGASGMVANAPNLHWRDVPFGALLQERLGPTLPVALYNDVNAITYGECIAGAGAGASDVLAVFVGTGVGGGILAGGRLIQGANMCAGEIGHFKVAYGEDARLCGCGMRGCIEAYVGGANLEARVRKELAEGADSAILRLARFEVDKVHPGHIDQAAGEGDPYALELYDEIAPLLTATLGNAINLLNPERLILGGGVISRTPVLREYVLTGLELAVNPVMLEPLSIVEPMLGDEAGPIGAALLAARRGG